MMNIYLDSIFWIFASSRLYLKERGDISLGLGIQVLEISAFRMY